MPSYVAVHRAIAPEHLSPLVALAEALLNRPLSTGVTIRNVAVVPRAGRLYVHADAPAAPLLEGMFNNDSLRPISVHEIDDADWSRLIALYPGAHSLREAAQPEFALP